MCASRKIIYTPTMEGIENFRGVGGEAVKGPGNSGEEGVLSVNLRFQMVTLDAMQFVSKSFLIYSENLLHRKNSSLGFQ